MSSDLFSSVTTCASLLIIRRCCHSVHADDSWASDDNAGMRSYRSHPLHRVRWLFFRIPSRTHWRLQQSLGFHCWWRQERRQNHRAEEDRWRRESFNNYLRSSLRPLQHLSSTAILAYDWMITLIVGRRPMPWREEGLRIQENWWRSEHDC